MIPILIGASMTGSLIAAPRWLRVAQREHYLAPAVGVFAVRWWRSSPINVVLGAIAGLAAIGVWFVPWLGWLGLATLVGPRGLSWRGVSSPLSWTNRLRRLAVGVTALEIVLAVAGLATNLAGLAVVGLVGIPWLVDAACRLLAGPEKRSGRKWVDQAAAKLAASGARSVAITGSYGKTTTKSYIGHLLGGHMPAVVTPASFNNRMGLARAINENLVPGTAVFVAEMGTYGKGEIAELCLLVRPEIAVITAIGPVHLERFGSEDAIVEAKSEILAGARVAILVVDHPLLAKLAEDRSAAQEVVHCSTIDRSAAVAVVDGVLLAQGEPIGKVGPDVFASNLACAVAVALSLGLSTAALAGRLGDLPVAPHRRQVSRNKRGLVVIDDTYNSNPAGAAAALETLSSQTNSGRKVVVTPGMVEMGHRQFSENQKLAALIGQRASDLVVVGRTNRAALLKGVGQAGLTVTVVESRQEAVAWVRANLGPGDAVLYENDLPDHYP